MGLLVQTQAQSTQTNSNGLCTHHQLVVDTKRRRHNGRRLQVHHHRRVAVRRRRDPTGRNPAQVSALQGVGASGGAVSHEAALVAVPAHNTPTTRQYNNTTHGSCPITATSTCTRTRCRRLVGARVMHARVVAQLVRDNPSAGGLDPGDAQAGAAADVAKAAPGAVNGWRQDQQPKVEALVVDAVLGLRRRKRSGRVVAVVAVTLGAGSRQRVGDLRGRTPTPGGRTERTRSFQK